MLFYGGGEGAAIVANEGIGWISEPGNYQELTANILKTKGLSPAEYELTVNRSRKLAATKYDFQAQIEDLNKQLYQL
jgi:hypothetical protein